MSAISNTAPTTASVTANREAAHFWGAMALIIIVTVAVCAFAASTHPVNLPDQASLIGP